MFLSVAPGLFPSTRLIFLADKVTFMSERSEFASDHTRNISTPRCGTASFAHFSWLKKKSEASAYPPKGMLQVNSQIFCSRLFFVLEFNALLVNKIYNGFFLFPF